MLMFIARDVVGARAWWGAKSDVSKLGKTNLDEKRPA